MVAIGFSMAPEAKHYEDSIAKDPRIDELRKKLFVLKTNSFLETTYFLVSAQLQMEFRLT